MMKPHYFSVITHRHHKIHCRPLKIICCEVWKADVDHHCNNSERQNELHIALNDRGNDRPKDNLDPQGSRDPDLQRTNENSEADL